LCSFDEPQFNVSTRDQVYCGSSANLSKSVRAPFHGTSARETGECAAADEDAASSTARLGARRDQQISVDILSVMEDD
jgi:hypothetical protein